MSDTNGRDFGKIIFWNDKGYGFIRLDDSNARGDLFVHVSAFPIEGEEPRIGDRVSFEVGADRRPGREPRTCAINVRFVNGDDKAPAGLFAPPTYGNAGGLVRHFNLSAIGCDADDDSRK